MKLGEFAKKLINELKCLDITSAELDVKLLCQYGLKISEHDYYFCKDMHLSLDEMGEILVLLERRKKFEPVAKILGHKEFWKYNFKVSSKVLDPRPDSEILIESFIRTFEEYSFDKKKQYRLLDLGCGSGCLLISFLKMFDNITGVGVDISEDAINVAYENSHLCSVSDRAEFVVSNWYEALDEKFDFVISNPPYIKTKDVACLMPDVRIYEPLQALDGGDDGLYCYREICDNIDKITHDNSIILFEIGHDMLTDVSLIMAENNIVINPKKDVFKDYAGNDRCVRGYFS